MITTTQLTRTLRGRVRKATLALALAAAVGACDVLEVELPGQATEEQIFVPSQAGLVVTSAIADIECAYSDFTAFEAAGYDDTTTRTVGWWGGRFERPTTPGAGGGCAGAQENTAGTWFKPLHKGRWAAEQVYGLLETEWDVSLVPNREELMATSALYAGIAYTYFGEFFCEAAADAGPLLTWSDALAVAEAWFTTAIGHIQTNGDFPIATNVTTSALQMAYLMRARARFAQNTPAKDAEAVQDAQQITQGFAAYVTRDAGAERTRVNRVYSAHVGLGWVALLGPIDWWTGTSSNNPYTGAPWPAVIPFTGYWDLAIQPDGRAVTDTGHAITLADAGAVADSRVPAEEIVGSGIGAGPNNYPRWEQRKFTDAGADFPLAKWEEAWLIEAQVAGGQTAIDLVNEIRTAHALPTISGAYAASLVDGAGNDAQEIEMMLIEEVRRTFFLEGGRFWSHKLRYDLWFPRLEGEDQWNFTYLGGVRMAFPDAEFTGQNPNLTDADQGTHCPPSQAPIIQ